MNFLEKRFFAVIVMLGVAVLLAAPVSAQVIYKYDFESAETPHGFVYGDVTPETINNTPGVGVGGSGAGVLIVSTTGTDETDLDNVFIDFTLSALSTTVVGRQVQVRMLKPRDEPVDFRFPLSRRERLPCTRSHSARSVKSSRIRSPL